MALHAYIDESGQLSHSRLSSDHFVLTAVACRTHNLTHLDQLLSNIRTETGRREGDRLTWKNLKRPGHRTTASDLIGRATFLRIASVIVCKRHLRPIIKDQDDAYLLTFQYLLQRLSWLGKAYDTQAQYTLSHIKNFPVAKLPLFENRLRSLGTTAEIKWDHLDPLGGRISNDKNTPRLQLADLAASATARAFEHHRLLARPADRTYLLDLLPRYMRGSDVGKSPYARNVLTSYGLKMHPWKDRPEVQDEYQWVLPLR
jgi:hypothetical protein